MKTLSFAPLSFLVFLVSSCQKQDDFNVSLCVGGGNEPQIHIISHSSEGLKLIAKQGSRGGIEQYLIYRGQHVGGLEKIYHKGQWLLFCKLERPLHVKYDGNWRIEKLEGSPFVGKVEGLTTYKFVNKKTSPNIVDEVNGTRQPK